MRDVSVRAPRLPQRELGWLVKVSTFHALAEFFNGIRGVPYDTPEDEQKSSDMRRSFITPASALPRPLCFDGLRYFSKLFHAAAQAVFVQRIVRLVRGENQITSLPATLWQRSPSHQMLRVFLLQLGSRVMQKVKIMCRLFQALAQAIQPAAPIPSFTNVPRRQCLPPRHTQAVCQIFKNCFTFLPSCNGFRSDQLGESLCGRR
mmetsp:Transcript_21465/g.52151  ORF Transcript_21465/g.52151 Transcript_21465/m.52151 type:complete len:204 (-) Transcript_21465:1150-1761(-)